MLTRPSSYLRKAPKIETIGFIESHEATISIDSGGNRYAIAFASSLRQVLELSPPMQEGPKSKVFVELLPDTQYFVRIQAAKKPSGVESLVFSPWSNVFNFTTCPDNMKSLKNGICFARHGYFKSAERGSASCTELSRSLAPGALDKDACSEQFTEIQNLTISPGFWRQNLSLTDIRPCPESLFCSGSPNASAHEDIHCSPRHSGIFCFACTDEQVMGANGCVDCDTVNEDEKALSIFLAVLLVLCMEIAMIIYMILNSKVFSTRCRNRRSRAERGNDAAEKEKSSRPGVFGPKLRILFGYFQVLLAYERLSDTRSLSGAGYLPTVFTFVTTFDITVTLWNWNIRCVYDYNHYDVLLLVTILPIALFLVLGMVALLIKRCCRFSKDEARALFQAWVSTLLGMLFLIYPSVSRTIFATFWCEDFPYANQTLNLSTSALRADYTISCETDGDSQRTAYIIYAGFMVLIYPVGVVVLYFALLLRYREILLKREEDRLVHEKLMLRKVDFLLVPYVNDFYWFEVYEVGDISYGKTFYLSLLNVAAFTEIVPNIFARICAVGSPRPYQIPYVSPGDCYQSVHAVYYDTAPSPALQKPG